MATNKPATRRTKDQLSRDRMRVSELLLQQYKRREIISIIKKETGYELSSQQLTTDIRIIRESWLAQSDVNYDAMINLELARLDSLEAELWRQLRNSDNPTVREIVDEYVRGEPGESDEERIERVVQKVSRMTQNNQVNPTFFTHIINVQKERRKLLGVYAPSRLGIIVNQEITVKGYKGVSPDDWPSVPAPSLSLPTSKPQLVEGEVVKSDSTGNDN